jgi:hypothetical protein
MAHDPRSIQKDKDLYMSAMDITVLQASDLDDTAPLHAIIAGPPATGMSFYVEPRYTDYRDDKGRRPREYQRSPPPIVYSTYIWPDLPALEQVD